MANPQKENGYVAIANEIMEALAKIRIPGQARQVLDVILRKTYGWQKKEDHISLSQFEAATGLKRSNVCQCLKILEGINIIYRGSPKNHTTQSTKSYYHQIQLYGFQKDFEKWHPVPKKLPSPQSHTRGSPKNHTKGSPGNHTYKRKETNKTKEKTLSNPEIKIFLDYYHQEFLSRFGVPPIIQGGKEGKIIQGLLKKIPLDNLKTLLQKFFTSSDKFISQSGYTLGVFRSQIQKLQIEKPKQAGLRAWAAEIIQEEEKENGTERPEGVFSPHSPLS